MAATAGGRTEGVGRDDNSRGDPLDVIGVLDADFVTPEAFARSSVDIWVPLDLEAPFIQTRNSYVLRTVGRLDDGSSADAAQQELDALAEVLAGKYPDDNVNGDGTPVRFPLRSLHEATVRDIGEMLSVLMEAVVLMLLIACANVANLFLASGTERTREMALRSALGAAKGTLLRMLLTETVVLGLLGGVFGVLLAIIGTKALTVLNAGSIPRIASVTVDWRIVGFAIALSVFTGILFGLLPALRSAKSGFASALRDGSANTTGTRKKNFTRDVLVVVEIALALVILIGAGLLFSSFLNLRRVDPGFDTENVLTTELRFGLPFGWDSTRYADAEVKSQFTSELLEALRAIPGVVAAGGSLSSPFSQGCCWSSSVVRSDNLADTVESWIRPVTYGYLETLDARLTTGRLFNASEDYGELFDSDENAREEQSVKYVAAVVNRTLAQRLWPHESPMGGELIRGQLRARVVGVIEDVSNLGLDRMDQFDLYVPLLRTGTVFDRLDLAVRYRGDAEAMAVAIRQTVWNIDPDLPVGTLLTMNSRRAQSMSAPRFYSTIFLVFAAIAFLLAASGIYASMTYVVGQRRQELGIRLALGGRPLALLGMVLGRGAKLTIAGMLFGLTGAFVLSRLLGSLVFGITATDPITFLTVSILLGVIAMLACYLPARKAAAADPLAVLRTE